MLSIVVIRDSKLDAFLTPVCTPHVGVAVRGFEDECRKDGSPVNAHPEDYSLFHVGTFDETTGVVSPVSPTLLVNALDVVKSTE